jgi:hypothetical protein
MTPALTEKIDFSKKLKTEKKKDRESFKKNNQTGRITRKNQEK